MARSDLSKFGFSLLKKALALLSNPPAADTSADLVSVKSCIILKFPEQEHRQVHAGQIIRINNNYIKHKKARVS